MRIGILGSGLMGGKLGTIFARAGHQVVFSYSPATKAEATRSRGAGTRAGWDAKRRIRRRPSLMYCGDDQNAKEVVATLIRDVGFDPLDSVPRTASEASRSKPRTGPSSQATEQFL